MKFWLSQWLIVVMRV